MRAIVGLLLVALFAPLTWSDTPQVLRDVDASPLESIAAKQSGRVVPLRSFAEAFVADVHGDAVMRTVDGAIIDSVLVLLESVFQPERAMEWCTLAASDGGDPMRAGDALEALAVGTSGTGLNAVETGDRALLEARLSLIVFASEELMIFPGAAGGAWMSIDEAAASRNGPLIDRLAVAWGFGDVPTINDAIADLAEEARLAQADAGVRPWVLRTERLIDQMPILSIAVLLYVAAALLASLRVFRAAMVVLIAGLALHLAAVVLRAIVLDRIPVHNHYESMAVVALLVASGGVAFAWRSRSATTLSLGSVIAAGLLIIAEWLDVPGRLLELEAGILSSTAILKYHVLSILAGYAIILFGAGVGAMLLTRRAFGQSHEQVAGLHRAQVRLAYWAFWVLALGIFLGAVWADRAGGRWWAFDPKETWALITWLVYLAIAHLPASRMGPKRRPIVVAILHLVGLLAMLWTYFGVILLLPSLHSYACSLWTRDRARIRQAKLELGWSEAVMPILLQGRWWPTFG